MYFDTHGLKLVGIRELARRDQRLKGVFLLSAGSVAVQKISLHFVIYISATVVLQGRGADEDPKETTIAASAKGEVDMDTILHCDIYKISSDGQRRQRTKDQYTTNLTLLRF